MIWDQLFYFQYRKLQKSYKEKDKTVYSSTKAKVDTSRVQFCSVPCDSSLSALRNLGFLFLHGQPAPDQVHSLWFCKMGFLCWHWAVSQILALFSY